MAVRVRSRWHRASTLRSPAEQASVVAALGWRLAHEAVKRMRHAGFDVEVGPQYFDVICEFLVFVLHAADRIVFSRLDTGERAQFTTALARRLADILEDNRETLLGAAASGICRTHLIDLANRRSDDYANLPFDESGPGFAFRCYFGNQIRELMPRKDQSWVVDHVMDAEAPAAVQALDKALRGLLVESPALD